MEWLVWYVTEYDQEQLNFRSTKLVVELLYMEANELPIIGLAVLTGTWLNWCPLNHRSTPRMETSPATSQREGMWWLVREDQTVTLTADRNPFWSGHQRSERHRETVS
ncbi:hypothetical protein CRG98_034417 [Punica granatum]|uniref:Uncharacterized protein n=1 Tax=Punica granatum TaxID=22663 RepID=A0A2I0IP39_PUNGR|nr:hypothetical protein CRG98_034417 [Punica granatum]